MSKLDKMLSNWVDHDLITHEQAQKISDYENSKNSHSWVLYSFLILGATIIGIGIISLVAANWKNIPPSIKLVNNFFILISLAVGSYLAWEKKRTILFEVFLISFMLACLASIGLISQIYHTGGYLYQALLLWSVITAGLAFASKKSFAPFIWATGLFVGITFTAINSPVFRPIFQGYAVPVYMAIPLLSGLLSIICRHFGGEGGQTKAFRSWTIISGMIALAFLEAKFWKFRSSRPSIIPFLPGNFLALSSAISVWIGLEYKRTEKILLFTALGFYLVPFHFRIFGFYSKVTYAAFTIAILSTMGIFMASLKLRGYFQFFLVALGIRFLILYFQALGGLAITGFGLIISGIIIILMVITWNKYRKEITTWAEGLVE